MSNTSTALNTIKHGGLEYLNKAYNILNTEGITIKESESTSIATLLEQIADLDREKVTTIVLILQKQEGFNELVRENIADINIANRYNEITEGFNSIRHDANREVSWAEKGKNNLITKAIRLFSNMKKGSIGDQYKHVKKVYLEVFNESDNQIKKERVILKAYDEYRLQLKQSQIIASELLKIAESQKKEASEQLSEINNKIENYNEEDPTLKIQFELDRELALKNYTEKDKKYQIVKDLSENLIIAYNASESVFARLQQVSDVKQQVLQRATTFFRTNEIVFTALSASITSLTGLKEATKTQEAMIKGINDGINDISNTNNRALTDGLKAGYGKTIDVQTIKNLVDSINTFQLDSYKLINQLRTESMENAKQIDNVVSEGKERFSKVIYEANSFDE